MSNVTGKEIVMGKESVMSNLLKNIVVLPAAALALVSTMSYTNVAEAESLLDGYDSEPVKFRMSCWTGETGWKTYAVQGNNVVVDSDFEAPIVEQQGNVYAAKGSYYGVEFVLIVDHDNRKVTQQALGIKNVFQCNQ